MVDVSNRLTGMASWVRERENERTYADAMDRARQLEQAGDLEGAQAAYNEASKAKPGDEAANTARERVESEQREKEAEQRRQEGAAQEARQQAEA